MMSKLSEEEIKDIIEELLSDPLIYFSQDSSFESIQIRANAIQGLLDLYNKEKEKNKELEIVIKTNPDKIKIIADSFNEKVLDKFKQEFISKDKIKELIKKKKDRINKLHPASDCVIIDDLENQIQVLQELLEERN